MDPARHHRQPTSISTCSKANQGMPAYKPVTTDHGANRRPSEERTQQKVSTMPPRVVPKKKIVGLLDPAKTKVVDDPLFDQLLPCAPVIRPKSNIPYWLKVSECTICRKRYATRSGKTKCYQRHLKDILNVCAGCGKIYAQAYTLKRHQVKYCKATICDRSQNSANQSPDKGAGHTSNSEG